MRRTLVAPAIALTSALALAACGSDDKKDSTPKSSTTTAETPTSTTMEAATTGATKASDLRAALEYALQEHVYLAGAATGEALKGNTAGFQAAAAALETNSNNLTTAITSIYGDSAGKAFDPLWKKHIGFFVDYTNGIAAGDTAKAAKAKADLTAYASEFGAFLESATEGKLTKDAVASLLGDHAMTLIAAIDAQKAGDATKAYANLQTAASHMPMIADPLAAAIAAQKGLS